MAATTTMFHSVKNSGGSDSGGIGSAFRLADGRITVALWPFLLRLSASFCLKLVPLVQRVYTT